MRHVVLSGAITTGPRRMVHPTTPAGLIAPPGRALGVAPRRLCTALCAVNLAAVTATADKNLSLAARAQKQPASRRRRRQQRTWTRSAMTGILPRHACSARCGARRRSETWPLRSAPCRPRQSGKFLPRAKQVAQAAILRARGEGQPDVLLFLLNIERSSAAACIHRAAASPGGAACPAPTSGRPYVIRRLSAPSP
jgi:hypothetical protein